jgi:hypothetical protein
MLDPKYDPNNYLKHQTIPIIQDNHKINESFGSSLLRIKWWGTGITKILPLPDLIGTFRIHQTTPFGDLEPEEYQVKISDSKKIYVQFLTIRRPDFKYRIEVLHPVGITRSHLEIWEYNHIDYLAPLGNMSGQSNPVQVTTTSDPAVAAALQQLTANTAATNTALQQLTTTTAAGNQSQAAAFTQLGQGQAAMTGAIMATNEDLTPYESTQYEVIIPSATFMAAASNNNKIHSVDPKSRELVISNNNAAGNIKLTLVAPNDGASYASITNLLGTPITPGGSFVISDPMCRDEVFAICSAPNLKIAVSKAAKV